MLRNRRRSMLAITAVGAFLLLAIVVNLRGHCQIPCGIYNDPVRFSLLAEHIRTIEKSMNQIKVLREDPSENANQLARWVMNKEDHANRFAEIVTAYFLQQRIKPAGAEDAAYVRKVVLCHQMLVSVMKAKQTTDLNHVAELRRDLDAFEKAYMGKKAAKAGGHSHEHGHSHGSGHTHAHGE